VVCVGSVSRYRGTDLKIGLNLDDMLKLLGPGLISLCSSFTN